MYRAKNGESKTMDIMKISVIILGATGFWKIVGLLIKFRVNNA
jgi:hypothetical protein